MDTTATEQVDDMRCLGTDPAVPISDEMARALAHTAALLGRSEEEITDAAVALIQYP